MNLQEILIENALRNSRLDTPYAPIAGIGCHGQRRAVLCPWEDNRRIFLPEAMIADPAYSRLKSRCDYCLLRFRYDFEFWCATCITLRHKLTGLRVPFLLNAPQRRLLATLEQMRLADEPIRVILLKSRQWGGSTMIQSYMAWIQIVHRTDWNSLIAAHVSNTAANLRRLYETILRNYPEELWEGDEAPRFKAVSGAANTREIAGRGALVTVGSSHAPDSVRGLDISMAHLSEIAFWADTLGIDPRDFMRSVCGTVPLVPLSLIVMESTANGAGNFFHSEWQRAAAGDSAYRPVFIPWYDIEFNRAPVPDPEAFVGSFTPYELRLWEEFGLTLEQIYWYRLRLRELGDINLLRAESPTTPDEAFVSAETSVFSSRSIATMRQDCTSDPERGEVQGLTPTGPDALTDVGFLPDDNGALKVWRRPDTSAAVLDRYIVAVDVGGRSAMADWSVIAVLDRLPPGGGGPEVVAQWRGHCDHDILAWKAAAIARWYADALLVVESNSLDATLSGSSQYILETLNEYYSNLYSRKVRDTSRPDSWVDRVGFHTNRETKALIITTLIAMVRDCGYTERDPAALNEMAAFRQLPNGNYGARRGNHDDILMTRAMALYVASTLPPATPLLY